MHNHHISSGSLSPCAGLLASLFACGVASGLTCDARGADVDSIRYLHLHQVAQREAAWAQLFPEGPMLSTSVIYLEGVLDDVTPWSHDLAIVDAFSGEPIATGAFDMIEESSSVPLFLAEAMEAGDVGEESQDAGSADATFVSGIITGPDGAQRAVFGVRLAIAVSELALIAPVHVDVFVPLAFPETSRAAGQMVFDGQDALFAPDQTECDAEAKAAAPQQTGGPSGASIGSALRQTSRNPDQPGTIDPPDTVSECQDGAWDALGYDLAAAWSDANILGSSCFEECILDPASGDDAESRVRHCLPGCGLGFLANGEGIITWSWSAYSAAVAECGQPPATNRISPR